MAIIICLSIHSHSMNCQHKRDGETGCDGLMSIMIKPAMTIIVTHLTDQVMYHYSGLV